MIPCSEAKGIPAVVRMLHVGRKAPKGWREEPGVRAIHLGHGLWLMRVVRLSPSDAATYPPGSSYRSSNRSSLRSRDSVVILAKRDA